MKLNISFQTLNLPAPFAHEYYLVIEFRDKIHVDFDLKYLERDEMEENENFTEGFTDQSDFSWTGNLHKNWKPGLQQIVDYSKNHGSTDKNAEYAQTEMVIHSTGKNENHKNHFFDDDDLSYMIQEIIQAIYETAKKESPLNIEILQIKKDIKQTTEINLSFASKQFNVTVDGKTKSVSWEQGIEMISFIYQPDYAIPFVTPKKQGTYISFDQKNWTSLSVLEKDSSIIGYEQQLLFLLGKL